jgi:hypothetical protein
MATTAHDQYYTQPEGGALHITYEALNHLGWAFGEPDFEPTHAEQYLNQVGNEQDEYICRDCGEQKGWHWNAGPAHGSDSLHWRGDFYSISEDNSVILCEPCFEEVTAEPDHGDEPSLEYTPQERAVMTFFDELFRILDNGRKF